METLEQIDCDIFLYLNGKHNSFFDTVFYFSSLVITWVPLYIFFLFLVIRKTKKNFWIPLLSIVILIAATDRISVLLKNSTQRYRPSHNLTIQDKVHIIGTEKGGQFSFVSSHAANTFGLAMYLLLLLRFKKKYLSLLLLSWAAFVSYGRIYGGLHYPADIACGGLLGILLAVLIYYLQQKIFGKQLSSTSTQSHVYS